MTAANLLLTLVTASTVQLKLHPVDLTEYPDAVCNDGTGQGYYITSGEGEDNGKWLVHLEGGGWCWDGGSCAERAKGSYGLTTNKTWTAAVEKTGVFDSNDMVNPLSGYRKVFVPYCTSDGWMGNRGASPATNNWHFRGQAAVEATLHTLASRHGFGSQPTTLVFSGCSAGGRGAMVTLDYLPGILNSISGNITLQLGILDSALYVDLEPLNKDTVSLAVQNQNVYTYANATGRVAGSPCGSIYQDNEAWKCLFGQYRMPTIEQPFIANAAQFDSYQLSVDVGSVDVSTYTPAQTEFALNEFQPATREALPSLPSSYYSASCLHHCVTEENYFWNITVNENASLASSIKSILEENARPRTMGQCTDSINCGVGCNPTTEPW